jgi:integrase
LIAGTGMRRGQVLALRWSDVDLNAGLLMVWSTLGRVGGRLVTSEPKTDRSRRTVRVAPPLVIMLRAHRAERAAAGLGFDHVVQSSHVDRDTAECKKASSSINCPPRAGTCHRFAPFQIRRPRRPPVATKDE